MRSSFIPQMHSVKRYFISKINFAIRKEMYQPCISGLLTLCGLKLASFKVDQRPYRSNAVSHVGAAVLAHVARSGRLDAAFR